MRFLIIVGLLFAANPLFAQYSGGSNHDSGTAAPTRNCDPGEVFDETDVNKHWVCTSTNTWTDISTGGTVDTSGTPVANDFSRFTDVDTIEERDIK